MPEQINLGTYPSVKKSVPTFYFIGVTTAKSSINQVFPLWMRELEREEVTLQGIDHLIHDAPEKYRRTVAQIKYDPLSLGGLVTTHKIDLYEAAKDMFAYLDHYAEICGEISAISKLDGRLEGHAKDPISSGLSMDAILGAGYFERTGGDVLCFGAGGSAVATLLHLINKQDAADRPRRFVVVNRSQGRLARMREMVQKLGTDIQVEYIWNDDPRKNDSLMEGMPAGSVVINATGMGKDSPGSPVTWEGVFPRRGVAWEFNYRGELDFLQQALAQAESRSLTVEDGWEYFLHGWMRVIAQVLHIDLDRSLFERLATVAEQVRK